MASDITEFFPAAGGGSLVSYDPLTLDRTVAQNANLTMKHSSTASQPVSGTQFWSYYETYSGGVGDYVQLPTTTSVYQTIVDITNTGKGGKLLNIISPLLFTSNTFTFKITIDGTETLIPITVSIDGRSRLVLGGLLEGETSSNTNYGPAFSYRSGSYSCNFGWQKNYNGFYTAGNASYMIPTDPGKVNHIEFKDSCKIEVIYTGTLPSYYSSTDYNAGAMIIQY